MVITCLKTGVKMRFFCVCVGDENKEFPQREQPGTSHVRSGFTGESFPLSCQSLEFGHQRFSLRLVVGSALCGPVEEAAVQLVFSGWDC